MARTTRNPARKQAFPCIRCEKPLENIQGSENQPEDGLEFTTPGHYGSTAFDPMNEECLIINICDDCLCAAAKKGLVGHTDGLSGKLARWRSHR